MNRLKIATAVIALMITSVPASTADGSITINIRYQTKAVRIRPGHLVGGTTVDIGMVMQTNGIIGEKISTTGPRPKIAARVRSLGKTDGSVSIHVIDSNTIERVANLPSHTVRMRVVVSGLSCRASVDYVLKPGHAEFIAYSTQLGTNAFYSSIEAVNTTCSIS
jgi:hypothetical protein